MYEFNLDFSGNSSPERLLPALVNFLRIRAAEYAQSNGRIVRSYAKTDLETAAALEKITQRHDRGRRRVELLDFEGKLSDAEVDADIRTLEEEIQQRNARILA